MADTTRYQPPANADPQLSRISDVLDAVVPQPRFGAVRDARVTLSPADGLRRLAPPSTGQTALLPAADATTVGKAVRLFVANGQGTLTLRPVSGTIDGASSISFAAGTYAITVWSGGDGRWATETPATSEIVTAKLADAAVTTAKLADLNVTTGKLAADAVTQAKLADSSVEPANLVPSATFGVPFFITQVLTAGITGTADDVQIYSGNAPFDFRIVDCWAVIGTAVMGSTVQLRSASGGGGSALSSALSSAATGAVRNNDTGTRQVSSGGSLFVRRSDRAVAARVMIAALRE